MSIVGTLPTTIKNGDAEDANVVMALFQFIQTQINANGCPATTGSGVLKGDGAGGTTAAVAGTDYVNGSFLQGFRNRLYNGNFAINQGTVSGTVTLGAGAYGHDGWKAGASGCTYTFATTGIDTIITITAGSLLQIVEGSFVEGGTYSLANRGTAQARVAVNGASTSGAYAAATASAPLQSASATGGLAMTAEFTTGTLDRVQFEPGTVATAFERRGPFELSICQRYFEVGRTRILITATAAGQFAMMSTSYKVAKRSAPAVTITNLVANTNTASNVLYQAAVTDSFGYYVTSAAAGAVEYVFDWSSNARL